MAGLGEGAGAGDPSAMVYRALEIVHHAASAPEERLAATDFLNEIKLSDECVLRGLYYAQVSPQEGVHHSDTVRHFGLQLLIHFTKNRWNDCDPRQQEGMKEMLLDRLMRFGVQDLQTEQPFIRSTIGVVVTEVIKREWPQQWPGLLDGLQQLFQLGPSQADLVLCVLRTLAEDLQPPYDEAVSSTRRQDLVRGLMAALPTLVPFLANVLLELVKLCVGGRIPPAEDILLESMLRTLKCYVDWIPFELIFNSNLMALFVSLLRHPVHRLAACECLLLIVDRKGVKEERAPLLSTFENIEAITDAMPPPAATVEEHDEEIYIFTKRLAQMLVSLGTVQLCTLWGPLRKETPPYFEKYLQAIISLLTHPSLLVSSFTLRVWTSLLKHDLARAHPAMQACYGPLLQFATSTIIKIGDPEAGWPDTLKGFYACLDFNTLLEFNAFFGLFRGQIMDVCKTISATSVAVAGHCAKYAAELLLKLLQTPLSASVDCYRAWDGYCSFCESVFAGAFTATLKVAKDPALAETMQTLDGCLGLVLEFQTDDAVVLENQLGLLSALMPTLHFQSERLPQVLSKLFEGITYHAKQDHDVAAAGSAPKTTGLSDSSKVRRKSCTTLISLCSKPPGCLLGALEHIYARVQQVLAAPDLFQRERRLLMEALLRAGNLLPSLQAHQEFLSLVLGPHMSQWCDPSVEKIVSHPAVLLEYAGLQSPARSQERTQLSLLASTLMVAMRHTRPRDAGGASVAAPRARLSGADGCVRGGDGREHPCAPLAEAVLPNVLRLMRTLHALWAEPAKFVPGEALAILDMRRSDVVALVPGAAGVLSRDYTEAEMWVDKFQLWLGDLRESCYLIVGSAARDGVAFGSAEAMGMIAEVCLCGLARQQVRHLKMLLRQVIAPLVRYAPTDAARLGPLGTLLAEVYGFLHQYLSAECQKSRGAFNSQLGDGSGPGSGTDMGVQLKEIVGDKQLEELTVDTVMHLSRVLGGTASPGDQQGHILGPMGVFILSSGQLAGPALQILTEAMTWPSSGACRAAAVLLASLVPVMGEHAAFHQFLFGPLLRRTLTGLSAHGQHNDCQVPLLNTVLALFGIEAGQGHLLAALAQLPGVSEAELAKLPQVVKRAKKNQRAFLKQLLVGAIGVSIGQVWKTPVKILDLPAKLFLARAPEPPPDDPEFDSSVLFGDG